MKRLFSLLIALVLCIGIAAQTDLQKVIDTEHAFAQLAADKNTRTAFLANMADDALVFVPDKTNGKAFWTARPEATSLLSWAPNFADVSSNGILSYTTGNWEFRPKGKADAPVAFGDFITLWLRQPDGKYKFVIDIGVGHPKPDKYLTEWTTAAAGKRGEKAGDEGASDVATGFYQLVTAKGLGKAYDTFAADDVRAYREDKMPILGKSSLKTVVAADKGIVTFAKRSVFFGSADLAYTTNTYTKTEGGKTIEKGNFMQIWKLRGGKWQIVLDIFKPVPAGT